MVHDGLRQDALKQVGSDGFHHRLLASLEISTMHTAKSQKIRSLPGLRQAFRDENPQSIVDHLISVQVLNYFIDHALRVAGALASTAAIYVCLPGCTDESWTIPLVW